MARKCILCGKKYEYCPGCPRDAKKETWYAIYDNENCKNISKALTDYNLNQITKDEAREALSKCDLSIQLDDHYRNEIDAIMAKPKRGMRTKIQIFDEIAAGFRLCAGGSHKVLGVDPDIAVFAKGMTNGYPISAVIGKKDVMQAAQDTFISSTFWTERIALAAAVKSIECYEKYNVSEHQIKIGNMVAEGWKEAAEKAGIPISISGIKPLVHFSFVEGEPLVYKTFFTQEMLKRGYLSALAVYTSGAHTEAIVSKYLDACYEVFCEIKKAETTDGGVKGLLRSEACHSGFERLN